MDAVGVQCSDGSSFSVGGLGGCGLIYPPCAAGLTNADVAFDSQYVLQVRPYCGDSPRLPIGASTYPSGTSTTSSKCPSGSRLIGIEGYSSDQHLHTINFQCASVTNTSAPSRDVIRPYDFRCPDDGYIVNLSGRAGKVVNAISIRCSDGATFSTGGSGGNSVNNPDCTAGLDGVSIASTIVGASEQPTNAEGVVGLSSKYIALVLPTCNSASGSPLGQTTYPVTSVFSCPPGWKMTGISGTSGQFLNIIQFVCAATLTVSPLFGGLREENFFYNFTCPSDGFIVRLDGRFASWTDAINVACSDGLSLQAA